MADLERIVAFLFTDVKGSVALWQRQPHVMERLIKRHDDIIELAVLRCSGRRFKTVGDASLAAFDTVGAALEAAQTAQEALREEDWTVDGVAAEPLVVRMVVHCGNALQRGGDYYGSEVNRTDRLLQWAQPGRILVSKSAQQLSRSHLPQGTELVPLGIVEVRDFGPEEVFELVPTEERAQWIAREASARRAAATPTGEPVASSQKSPADCSGVREHLRQRIDLWSGPTQDLDRRFTPITVRLAEWSCGEAGWSGETAAFDDLWTALSSLPHRSVVLLGEPGSGKSTLLRHLDLVLARGRASSGSGPIPFYVELNRCRLETEDGEDTARRWLEEQWNAQCAGLPPLASVMRDPGVVFLLDGLDELPRDSLRLDPSSLMRWKRFVQDDIPEHSPSRVLLSCRTQDYGLPPLSTPTRAVPILYTEALNDEQIRVFMDAHAVSDPETKAILEAWHVNGLLRNPFTLRLTLEHVSQHGRLPRGRAELFATLIRQVTLREIERDHPLFKSGGVLSDRDLRRNLFSPSWTSSHALPDDSGLFTAFGELAHELAAKHGVGLSSHVEISRAAAAEILGDAAPDIELAGIALGLLEENPENDSLRFSHLLVQAFLAARLWLREPRVDLIDRPVDKGRVQPPLDKLLRSLTPSDVLPPIAPSVWEDVARLAAEMNPDPHELLRRLAERDLALAGRAASDPGVAASDALRRELADRLAGRLEDPSVDLRARLEAARAMEILGDPRFTPSRGEHGDYLLPPIVDLPAGRYAIGSDERSERCEGPRQMVELPAFGVWRFPVTCAEFERFVDAGGYKDERWWVGEGARIWRSGVDTGKHRREWNRTLYDRFSAAPDELDRLLQSGQMTRKIFDRWQERIRLTVEEYDALILQEHPDARYLSPAYWHDPQFRSPSRPVVGVTWYEARAYAAWLAAQSGLRIRLPTEYEYEAACRGLDGRANPWGESPPEDGWMNITDTHIQGTTPVGAFPESHTPEGIADLLGNVMQWTLSPWGRSRERCDGPYPDQSLARDPATGLDRDAMRVARGAAWDFDLSNVDVARRGRDRPEARGNNGGFRLVVES